MYSCGSPLVSVVVPSFNQGRFIRSTIDSILQQNYRPIEIHVVDGASTDETVEVLKSYGEIPELRWVSEPDRGVVDAVNKGFSHVRGEIVGIQSSDDVYLPGAIARAVAEFQRQQNVGLVYGDTIKVDADGNELSRSMCGPFSIENMLLMRTWIPQPSAFFRRVLLEECGGWDERVPYAADTDLWLRMAFRTTVIKIDEYLSGRRIHDAQRDTQVAKIARDYRKMIDQSADLERAPANVQRAARAGRELICVRYNATGTDWAAAGHLIRAALADRRALAPRRIWQYAIAMPVRRRLSPVKRWILGRPQGGQRLDQ